MLRHLRMLVFNLVQSVFLFIEIEKQRPIQRRIRELVLYYISAGQTSLLQVQWSLHWLCLNLYGDNGILRNTGNT